MPLLHPVFHAQQPDIEVQAPLQVGCCNDQMVYPQNLHLILSVYLSSVVGVTIIVAMQFRSHLPLCAKVAISKPTHITRGIKKMKQGARKIGKPKYSSLNGMAKNGKKHRQKVRNQRQGQPSSTTQARVKALEHHCTKGYKTYLTL